MRRKLKNKKRGKYDIEMKQFKKKGGNMMDVMKKVLFLVVLIFCVGSLKNAGAQDYLLTDIEGLKLSGDFAFYSQYISKGFICDRDPVIQSGIYAKYKDVKIGLWGSYDVDNNDSLKSDELDYLFDITHQFNNVSVSLGHIYYDLTGTNTYSKDFYVACGLDVLLSPKLTCYYDYVSPKGTYTVLELSHSIPFKQTPLSLELSSHIAYNHKYSIGGEGGDYGFGLGVKIPLTEKLTFTPNINYVAPFGDVKDSDDGGQKNRVYGGCMLNYSF